MAKCPKCGAAVTTPAKTWSIPSRKPLEHAESAKLVVGIFECTDCKARFRSALEIETKAEKTNIKSMVERIKGIQGELMQTLRNLREKIKTLETERSTLMIEIDKLRSIAESKVNALESEVSTLRDEVQSLRELLGYSEETEN